MASQPLLDLCGSPMDDAIDEIHRGTAIYTAVPEIEALLDRLDWPRSGTALLDPGAGNGGFLVAALRRLDLGRDDVGEAIRRVHGYEFHAGAATAARTAIRDHLSERGWSPPAADRAAQSIVEVRDYLLTPVPVGRWDVIAANPPYWRYANLPERYRPAFDACVARHARGDLLYAYLQRCADIVAPGGRIGLVTADRWLLNSGSAELRERIGTRFTVSDVVRLDSASVFYRPKSRTKGTPARVHPVSLVLTPGEGGRPLTRDPFRIDHAQEVDGVPLAEVATVRLAPWVGPEGIFVIRDPSSLPSEHLVPCYEPDDIDPKTGLLGRVRRWVIATDPTMPHESVLRHLDATLDRMPARGRRATRWLPPESFHDRLPLSEDAVMVPRIATELRAIPLPAGTMPVNHNLVVVSGLPAVRMKSILEDPRVRAHANSLALRLEGGYHSYTATLIKRLRIPYDLL